MNPLFSEHQTAERITLLRAEIAELAFALDTQGRRDAADVANLLGGRLDQVIADLSAGALTSAKKGLRDLS